MTENPLTFTNLFNERLVFKFRKIKKAIEITGHCKQDFFNDLGYKNRIKRFFKEVHKEHGLVPIIVNTREINSRFFKLLVEIYQKEMNFKESEMVNIQIATSKGPLADLISHEASSNGFTVYKIK